MANKSRLVLMAIALALVVIISLSLDMAFRIQTPQNKSLKITQVKDIQLQSSRFDPDLDHAINRTKCENTTNSNYFPNATRGAFSTAMSTTPAITQPLTSNVAISSAFGQSTIQRTHRPTPIPEPTPSPAPPLPILALSYTGSAGPKRCRGSLIQHLTIPRPTDQWKNGTCINLPTAAQCGVFYAEKQDNCEARLFNVQGCFDSTETYVNTIVFMPEERAVGSSMWRSMLVRCGVEVVEVGRLDPAVLGAALKTST